jgi:hypothetical protein
MYMIMFGITTFVMVMLIMRLWYNAAKLTAWKKLVSPNVLLNLSEFDQRTITRLMQRPGNDGTNLDFSDSWIGDSRVTWRVSRALRNTVKITKITCEVDWGMKALLEIALARQPTTLDLSNGSFGDTAAAAVASVLYKMPKLKKLKLTNNNICDEGANSLALALYKVQGLQHLDMTYNLQISERAAKKLRTAWGGPRPPVLTQDDDLHVWYFDRTGPVQCACHA